MKHQRIKGQIKELFVKALGSPANSPLLKDMKHALVFEMTSKIVQTPLDILGQRRVAVLQDIIEDVVQQYQDIAHHHVNLFTCNVKKITKAIQNLAEWIKTKLFRELKSNEERSQNFFWMRVKRLQWSIILPIGLSVLFYSFDYYTDIGVTVLYSCQFISLVNSNSSVCKFFMGSISNHYIPRESWLNFNIEDAKHFSDSYFVFERNIGLIFLFSCTILAILLLVALLVMIPTLKTLRYQFKIKSSMRYKRAEEGRIVISEEEISKRFNVSFNEATIEGSLQFCFQMSTFLSCAWVLNWAEEELRRPIEKHSSHAVQFSDIWISATMSLLSQSWAQYKRRMLLHEFSDTALKKLLFLSASFLNTIMSMMLLVSCTTAWYDMQVVLQLRRMFVSDSITDGIIVFIILGAIGYFCVRIAIALLGNALRLPTAATYPDITTIKSEEFKDEIRNQYFGICLISYFTALLNIHNTVHYNDQEQGPGFYLHQLGKMLTNSTGYDLKKGNKDLF